MDAHDLAATIRAAVDAIGWTQKDVGKALGLSGGPQVARLCNGSSGASQETIDALCALLVKRGLAPHAEAVARAWDESRTPPSVLRELRRARSALAKHAAGSPLVSAALLVGGSLDDEDTARVTAMLGAIVSAPWIARPLATLAEALREKPTGL